VLADNLTRLEADAFASGYLSRDKLENNLRVAFHDWASGVDWFVQINRARSAYAGPQPPLPSGARCRICRENVGAPGRENLRALPLNLGPGREFFFQWTPFPLFPGHGVVIQNEHVPMRMNRQTLEDGAAWLALAPEYTFFSNSDRDLTGASILDHLHYQVGRGKTLPVMQARVRATRRWGEVRLDYLDYPLAAVRVIGPSATGLIPAAEALIEQWKERDPARHSLNVVWRQRERGSSELTLLFRSQSCVTPGPLLRYKTEGVGVIEAGGEFIFPVPTGPEASAIEHEILTQGRTIALGFLQGLDPWKDRGHETFSSFEEPQ